MTRKLPEFNLSAWDTSFNAAGNLASILKMLERGDEAEQLCRQAVMECEALRSEYPNEVSITKVAGKLHGSLGGQLAVQGKLPDAESELRAALAAVEQTLPDGASPATLFRAEAAGEGSLEGIYDAGVFLSHAQDQVRLGQVLRGQDRLDEAVNVLREAMFVLGQLMVRNPDSPNFKGARAQGEWELAKLLRDRDLAEAEQHFRTAAELYGGFVQRYPQDPRNHVKLGQVLNNLGCLLVDAGNLAEAQQTFEAAVQHEERALELRPDVAKARHTLDRLYANLTLVTDAGSARVEVRPLPEPNSRRFEDACRLRITVSVHGRTRLALQHDKATWEFMPKDAASEGRTESGSTPTEVCLCGARIDGRSDLEMVRKTDDLATSLPGFPCEVQLATLQNPGTVRVVQPPDEANDQTIIIEFDGGDHKSACKFIVLIDIVSQA